VLFASAVAAILIDQLSKTLIVRIPAGGALRTAVRSVWLQQRLNTRPGFIRLSPRAAIVTWIGAFTAMMTVVMNATSLSSAIPFSLGLVFGGALSNLIDRVTRGYVVDFIAVRKWRTFNLADVAMVAGSAMGVLSLLL
jgi:signal peptidase II